LRGRFAAATYEAAQLYEERRPYLEIKRDGLPHLGLDGEPLK
jgi:hypothetical protein